MHGYLMLEQGKKEPDFHMALKFKVVGVLLLLIGASFTVAKYKEELGKCAPYKKVYSTGQNDAPLEHLNILDKLDPKLLAIGKMEMAKHKVVICGISRDTAIDSAVMLKAIENLGSEFMDYRVIVFENDSTDGTKEVLKDWQAHNSKVNIASKDYGIIKRPTIKFMADARNEYIKILESDPEYSDFDLVMVVDMDMEYGIDSRGVQNSFSKFSQWDAVCANGVYNYKSNNYDRFAFNKDEVLPTPDGSSADYNNTARGEKRYSVEGELVPVLSCFGGFAFYKKAAIRGCLYDSINENCEHIEFNKCLRDKNGGKMFMNPAQVIKYHDFQSKMGFLKVLHDIVQYYKSKNVCY